MFNKIINSPFTLGTVLTLIHIAHRSFTGNIATTLGIILPLAIIVLYTYFTQKVFTKNFKYLTILTELIVGLGLAELFCGTVSNALRAGSSEPIHPGAALIGMTLVLLGTSLVNYLYLTFANKLGLWILKKIK